MTARQHLRLAAIVTATTGLVVMASAGSSGPTSQAASPELADRAASAGINLSSTPSWDLCVGDYDNDGDQDFHASLHMKNPGALFRNNNDGTVTRIAENVISPKVPPGGVDRHGCAWADVDGNGLLDLYSSAGRWADNLVKDERINNELWLQRSLGAFEDVATWAGVAEPCTRGRQVVFEDWSGDGRPDLFLGAQKERDIATDPCNGQPNYPYNEQSKVFVNRGNDRNGNWLGFRPAPEFNVSQPNVGARLALSWDQDHDGKPDLLTVTFAGHAAFLHRNTGSGFQEVARAGKVSLPLMNGAAVGDLNRDGIEDLVYATNGDFAFRRGTAAGVSTTTVRLGTVPSGAIGWDVALGDINGDGRTDVYGLAASSTGTGNPADILFLARADGGFDRYVAPSAGGDANDVEAVRVQGRDQFVVLNGGNDESENPGPVQLVAWR